MQATKFDALSNLPCTMLSLYSLACKEFLCTVNMQVSVPCEGVVCFLI